MVIGHLTSCDKFVPVAKCDFDQLWLTFCFEWDSSAHIFGILPWVLLHYLLFPPGGFSCASWSQNAIPSESESFCFWGYFFQRNEFFISASLFPFSVFKEVALCQWGPTLTLRHTNWWWIIFTAPVLLLSLAAS